MTELFSRFVAYVKVLRTNEENHTTRQSLNTLNHDPLRSVGISGPTHHHHNNYYHDNPPKNYAFPHSANTHKNRKVVGGRISVGKLQLCSQNHVQQQPSTSIYKLKSIVANTAAAAVSTKGQPRDPSRPETPTTFPLMRRQQQQQSSKLLTADPSPRARTSITIDSSIDFTTESSSTNSSSYKAPGSSEFWFSTASNIAAAPTTSSSSHNLLTITRGASCSDTNIRKTSTKHSHKAKNSRSAPAIKQAGTTLWSGKSNAGKNTVPCCANCGYPATNSQLPSKHDAPKTLDSDTKHNGNPSRQSSKAKGVAIISADRGGGKSNLSHNNSSILSNSLITTTNNHNPSLVKSTTMSTYLEPVTEESDDHSVVAIKSSKSRQKNFDAQNVMIENKNNNSLSMLHGFDTVYVPNMLYPSDTTHKDHLYNQTTHEKKCVVLSPALLKNPTRYPISIERLDGEELCYYQRQAANQMHERKTVDTTLEPSATTSKNPICATTNQYHQRFHQQYNPDDEVRRTFIKPPPNRYLRPGPTSRVGLEDSFKTAAALGVGGVDRSSRNGPYTIPDDQLSTDSGESFNGAGSVKSTTSSNSNKSTYSTGPQSHPLNNNFHTMGVAPGNATLNGAGATTSSSKWVGEDHLHGCSIKIIPCGVVGVQ